MNFEAYIDQAWTDHGANSEKVAAGFADGAKLAQSDDHLSQLIGLMVHVMGEHLARWDDGLKLMNQLKTHSALADQGESGAALRRSTATLEICRGDCPNIDSFSISDQVRIWAMAAASLSDRDTARASSCLKRSLALAEIGLEKTDRANRSLAVTGNNLACSIEEKANRSSAETELMILAAQTARQYWERAGTWLEVERSEYRLANTYLQAGNPKQALLHAEACLDIAKKNNAAPLEFFFGLEALALVHRARGNRDGFESAANEATQYFEKLATEDKSWCEATLKKIAF